MYVSFAYSGWNAAAYVAGEIELPATHVAARVLVGTGAVMLLYIGAQPVFLYAGAARGDGDRSDQAPGRRHRGARIIRRARRLEQLRLADRDRVDVGGERDDDGRSARLRRQWPPITALPRASYAYYSKRGVPVCRRGRTVRARGSAFTLFSDPDHLLRLTGFTLAMFASADRRCGVRDAQARGVAAMQDGRRAWRRSESGGKGPGCAPIGFRSAAVTRIAPAPVRR